MSAPASILPRPRSRARGLVTMGIYQPLFLLAFLVYSPVLLWRLLFDRRYRAGLTQRMGYVPRIPGREPVVWIHGVSVGEVKAASNILARLRQHRPDLRLVVSATTPNGHHVARQEHPDLPVVFYPLDFARFPARALARLRPACVLLMELEIWPNFLQAAQRRGVPVAVINGRISERTFRGYRLARGLLPQLDLISIYCVQDRIYRQRLLDLGVDAARVHVTGNMKYDSVVMGGHAAQGAGLRAWLAASGQLVVVCGSTHGDEEAMLVDAVRVAAGSQAVRLVLVPRHPERAAAVCEVVWAAQRMPVRWSESSAMTSTLDAGAVVVVDTIGQLQRFYAACDVAFVGGSLVPHGGQNMLEPAAQGRAVVFGPHTANFRTDVELLLREHAAIQVQDSAGLVTELRRLFGEADWRHRLGERAKRVIADNRGATERTLELIRPLLAMP
ncbi:MAG: 3-deoxy-D-manno-octulosonic acid transferase [Planctomycetes bacterium]|nr:3-deoxy-D-manno-octulosonic acid transferase [Planctomycetota bacterium]